MRATPAEQAERLRAQIEAGERGGVDADRELLEEFDDRLQLLATQYSGHRRLKLLRHATIMAENVTDDGGAVLDPAVTDRSHAEDVVRWIHSTYDNHETDRDYRVALRVFGKHVADPEQVETDDDGIPLALSWVSAQTPSSYDPAPDPSAMLDWDDVNRLIDAARNSRDAAMVALLMDAGPRGGEFFEMEVGDITDSDQGLRVSIDGKTGQRPVTLIPSVPYVNRWLADHPGDGADPLWSSLNEPDAISKTYIYNALKSLADRAGIDPDRKPMTPTNFRKSNASWLARTGANAALIEERQGRSRGSDAVARYVATFGEANEQSAYAKLHGRDVDQETAERRDVVDCPRCREENPPDVPKCMWCGQGLDPQGAADAETTKRQVREAIAELDPDSAKQFNEAMETIEKNPALRAAFLSAASPDSG